VRKDLSALGNSFYPKLGERKGGTSSRRDWGGSQPTEAEEIGVQDRRMAPWSSILAEPLRTISVRYY
jgi:hypothetical protein